MLYCKTAWDYFTDVSHINITTCYLLLILLTEIIHLWIVLISEILKLYGNIDK